MDVHGRFHCPEWVTDADRTICKRAVIGNPPCSVKTSEDCIFEAISLPEIITLGGAGRFFSFNNSLLVNLGRNEIVRNETVFTGLGLTNDVTLTEVKTFVSKSELFNMFKRLNVADWWDFSLQTFMKSTGFLSYQLSLSTVFLLMLIYKSVTCLVWIVKGYKDTNNEKEKRDKLRRQRRHMDREGETEFMTIEQQ